MKAQERILLESGTNEVEVLEFELGGQGFGVNVLKVQAIEQFTPDKVTGVQLAHPAVIGSYQYRDRVITLINLGKELRVHALDEVVLRDDAVAAVLAATPPVGDPDSADRTTGRDLDRRRTASCWCSSSTSRPPASWSTASTGSTGCTGTRSAR